MINRIFSVYYGSRSFFENEVEEVITKEVDVGFFHELVQKSDQRVLKQKLDYLIVRNVDYHALSDSGHYSIGNLINLFTNDDAHVYIHNPTKYVELYIDNEQKNNKIADLNIFIEPYDDTFDKSNFIHNINKINENIIGQENAIDEIAKTLWFLKETSLIEPYVIMFYGESSIGKTELAKNIADLFFGGRYLVKYLSMFQNNTQSDYFFGSSPNSKTLAYELMERESNFVFLDEIDKCPPHFHSAFYTLFDNTEYEDSTYIVNTEQLLIVLTANYNSIEEVVKNLGEPISYRINKFIKFEKFTSLDIYNIIQKEIDIKEKDYIDIISKEELYAILSTQVNSKNENARSIRNTVQNVIEQVRFDNEFKNVKFDKSKSK